MIATLPLLQGDRFRDKNALALDVAGFTKALPKWSQVLFVVFG
jgi:hypothetical protein